MKKKDLLSGREKELFEMAEQFELASQEGRHIYMDAEDWADLADWFAIHRKMSLAHEAAENGLSQHPTSTPLLVQQAYLYLDNKQLEKASSIAEAIEEDHFSEVKILKATIYLKQGEDWKTQELLDSLKDKTSLTSIVEVSYMYIEAGWPDLAWPWLESGKELYNKEEAYLTVLANYYHAVNDLQEAKKIYNQLIDLKPYTALYWFELARCYLDEGQYDKAIEAAEFAIVSDEEFGEAHLLLANAYHELGNEDKAVEYFENARELNALPEEVSDAFNILCQAENEQWEDTIQNFVNIVNNQDLSTQKGQDQAALIYTYMAQCKLKLDAMEEACELVEKAIEIQPNLADPYVISGTIAIMQGNREKGLNFWKKAASLSSDITITWYIGSEALKLGELEVAVKHFEEVLKCHSDYPLINEQITIAYLFLQDYENFNKYNQRCKNPMNAETVKAIIQYASNSDQKKMLDTMNEIINKLYK